MSLKDEIAEHLKQFGCTKREVYIYLEIFVNGATSVQEIAKRTGYNRITVHSAVEQLLEKQLIAESREGKRRRVFVESPKRFKEITDNKIQELLKIRESTDHLVELLDKLPKQNYAPPDFHIYNGIKGYKRFLEEALEAKKELRIFVDIEQLQNLLTEEYLLDYYKRRANKKIFSKMIWPNCAFTRKIAARDKEFNLKVGMIKKSKGWKVGFYSWNDKVGITSFVEGQIICTIIKNREIALFYQNLIFDSLWERITLS